MNTSTPAAATQLNKLQTFRQAAYSCLGPARDALFELTDAALLTDQAPSFAYLALSPVFRRGWPSLYEALQDGRPDPYRLLARYAPLVQPTPTALATRRVVLAGDSTAWPRLWARTLAERAYWHAPTPVPGQRPITIGHGFSSLAWVPEGAGSWALPLLHERIPQGRSALECAATQLRTVTAALPAALGRPLACYDSAYGCAPFVAATADIAVDKILRLRPNLSLRQAPGPYKGRGPRPKHGPAFQLNVPGTWPTPAEELTVADAEHGPVQIQGWSALHFRDAPAQPFSVIRVQRLRARGTKRDPKAQWLAWVGEPAPPLAEWWAVYGRRFAQDHWYRFAKGPLHGTLPTVQTVEQAERWAHLRPLMTWELWLARGVVDRPRPWQAAQPGAAMTPGRVRQGWGGIMAAIGTPTARPKPRGKAPGWPRGKGRKRRERQAVVKKGPTRRPPRSQRGGQPAA